MNGALKPARLPTVLMRATPAAAAMPVRNFVGSVQKFGSAEKIAMAVRVMTAIVAAGEPAYSASGIETAPRIAGAAMCQVRSPRRDASRDQKYMTIAAGRYGIAVIRPFWNVSNVWPVCVWKPSMIVGRKKASA